MGFSSLIENLKKSRSLFLIQVLLNLFPYARYFDEFSTQEYAKVGTLANQTIILEKGSNIFLKFSHSLEPYLRKLGLNTSLVNAEIHLNENFVLAEKDKELNAEQCKILVTLFFFFMKKSFMCFRNFWNLNWLSLKLTCWDFGTKRALLKN